MARAVVVALWCAAAASATRYVDYSGVKMPLYGGGSDYDISRDLSSAALSEDYRGHSPDAPAALDYRYEEEPNESKSEKLLEGVVDAKVWRRPGRKQRELVRHDTKEGLERRDKYNTQGNEVSKYKSNHRFTNHRSRLKLQNSQRDELSHRRPRYNGHRIDKDIDVDTQEYFNSNIDRDEFRNDKSKDFEDDINNLVHMTTEKLSRKKTIDRVVKSRPGRDDMDMVDDDIIPDRRIKSEDTPNSDYPTHPYSGKRRPSEQRERYRPIGDDDDIPDHSPQRPSGQKQYDEYRDYYDMKRVKNIKNKLPLLLRRTTTRMQTSTPMLDRDLFEVLWTHRRAALSPRTTTTETAITITTSATTSLPTIVATELSTTSVHTTTDYTSTASNKTKLSLSERSRLSILKKAMRKESVKSDLAKKKPPVLLQVTKKLHTLVMVEPPVSQQPWMRAREVSGDSPERLEKVKKLMRQKLVASAKSMQDLTDNWDNLICDYIDVSLINHAASTVLINRFLLFVNIISLFM